MFWGKRNVLRDPRTEKNVLQTINCDIEFPSTIVLLGRRTYFLFPFDEMIAKLLNIPISISKIRTRNYTTCPSVMPDSELNNVKPFRWVSGGRVDWQASVALVPEFRVMGPSEDLSSCFLQLASLTLIDDVQRITVYSHVQQCRRFVPRKI